MGFAWEWCIKSPDKANFVPVNLWMTVNSFWTHAQRKELRFSETAFCLVSHSARSRLAWNSRAFSATHVGTLGEFESVQMFLGKDRSLNLSLLVWSECNIDNKKHGRNPKKYTRSKLKITTTGNTNKECTKVRQDREDQKYDWEEERKVRLGGKHCTIRSKKYDRGKKYNSEKKITIERKIVRLDGKNVGQWERSTTERKTRDRKDGKKMDREQKQHVRGFNSGIQVSMKPVISSLHHSHKVFCFS